MSGTDARMVDRAYWDERILGVAAQVGANAINVYAFDHYLKDINGYCGGWTPEVVARIYARGFDVHATFCFRDGEAPLDPATCVRILEALGIKRGAWVHNDIENGAMDSLAHDVALSQGLRAAGYRSAPYGLASTLRGGYLQDADGPWVASYVLPWDQPPALVDMPNVGSWQFAGWQYSTTSPAALDVDLSVHNFPSASAPAPASPQPGGDDLLPDERQAVMQMKDQVAQLWADLVLGPRNSGQLPAEFQQLQAVHDQVAQIWTDYVQGPRNASQLPAELKPLADMLTAVKTEVDAIKALPGGEPIAARIESALRQA